MSRFGFCGGSFPSQSAAADAERTQNWIPEPMESGQAKSAMILVPSPGLLTFATLAGESSVPGMFSFNGRCFAGGANLWELSGAGVATNRGALAGPPRTPVQMAANQNQLLICSNGVLYIFTFATNTLTPVTMSQLQGSVAQIGATDSYFVATIQGTNFWQISQALDGFTWPGVNVARVSVFPEAIQSMICDHREVILFGQKASQAYYDSGNTFPFDVVPGGFAEVAGDATYGTVKCDNTVYWLGGYEGGLTMAFKGQGYTPVRVSNHAIEYQWSQYPQKASDAIAYSYQDSGHSMWVIYFPSGNATWVYDVSTGLWHERTYLDPKLGTVAHFSRSHCYAFGKHLVGDRQSGTVYEMSSSYYSDNGAPIRRMRQAPYINVETEWLEHKRFQLDLEAGVGLQIGQGSSPNIMLSWSDDGGHTWSNEHTFGWGRIGTYRTRGIIWRLGVSRGRVYRVATSDPIPWRITDAYVNDPTDRLSNRIRASA